MVPIRTNTGVSALPDARRSQYCNSVSLCGESSAENVHPQSGWASSGASKN